jgi:hypothetical protein
VTGRARLAIVSTLALLAASACGAKGPPLAPLRPVPAAPTGVSASRIGNQVTLRVVVPQANADPESPLSISAIEIYARTLPMGSEPPVAEQLVRKEFLVGTIPVKPPPPLDETGTPVPPPATAPPDLRPGPGDTATWTETVPAVEARPLELTRAQKARVDSRRTAWLPVRPSGVLVPWPRMTLPTRYYAAVGVSERRRPGSASTFAAVAFGPPPAAPADLDLTYSETELKVSWTTAEPNAPVIVIESDKAGVEKPAPVQDAPMTGGSWTTPVTFDVERCFVVRAVIRRGTVSTESQTVGPKCLTPKDTFAPPAPANPLSVSGPLAVTLVWDAVTAPDLAGYLVLRANSETEEPQALTPKPIPQARFEDATARAGQRYVYYVVAVDAAGNRSPRSNGVIVERFVLAGK